MSVIANFISGEISMPLIVMPSQDDYKYEDEHVLRVMSCWLAVLAFSFCLLVVILLSPSRFPTG